MRRYPQHVTNRNIFDAQFVATMLAHSARRIYAFNAMTMLTPERGEPDRGDRQRDNFNWTLSWPCAARSGRVLVGSCTITGALQLLVGVGTTMARDSRPAIGPLGQSCRPWGFAQT